MIHHIHFNYNGKWSYDMGVKKVNVSGGLFEEELVSSKDILEERVSGRDRPYFYGVDRSPLQFTLHILFEDNLSVEKVRKILRWLDQDSYKPFYTYDEPDRWMYSMPVNDVKSMHNGIASGYLTLEMRTDSPTTHTPFFTTEIFEVRGGSNGKIIEVSNLGDFECKPIVHIEKRGRGSLSIENLSDFERDSFTFVELENEEKVSVDCENKEIVTDSASHRYDSFNGKYLGLTRGVNRLEVTGDCDIQFEMEFKTY